MTIENDSHDTRLDTALERLRDRGADAPAPGAALEAMLRDIAPVKTRNPRRQFAIVAVAAAAYVTAIVLVAHLRIDLDGLPMPWFVATAAAWAVGFAAPMWLALVPRAGAVMPRAPLALVAAVVAAVGFIAIGLCIHPSDAASASLGASNFLLGRGCFEMGVGVALAPAVLGAFLVRGSAPSSARPIAAAIGAAGGAAGGLVLHLHCHVADGLHVAFMHGGVVAFAAVAAALLVPFF